MFVVAIILPWLALMLIGRVGQGIFCLLLQLTGIGWLPAAIWAVIVVNRDRKREHQELLAAIREHR